MAVVGTYFFVYVADMDRATAFYRNAFGADVKFASPNWTSLSIAGVAIGLHHAGPDDPGPIGLGFDVDDIGGACQTVEAAGGRVVKAPEARPEEGITIATLADTEGNEFSVTLAKS
jgi:predicted enzyme related to lactoylglutathione lyase